MDHDIILLVLLSSLLVKTFDKITLSVFGFFLLSLLLSHWSSNKPDELLPDGDDGLNMTHVDHGVSSVNDVEKEIIYPDGALPGELIIKVLDVGLLKCLEDEYGFIYLSGIPELGYGRIRFNDGTGRNFFKDLNLSEKDWDYNYPITSILNERTKSVTVEEEGDQDVLFSSRLLDCMGLSDVDLSFKGKGIRVVFLDSGFETNLSIDLVPENGFWSVPFHPHAHWMKTMCSGTVDGAFSGIAPVAELMSVKVLNASGEGDLFTLAAGIVMAAKEGADVINLSLGSNYGNDVLEDAVQFAYDCGSLLIGAAGDEGMPRISYPAAYPEVLAITAINANNDRLPSSNYGEGIDLASPGIGILTEDPSGERRLLNGTSIATAITSATAAMVWSDDPSLSNEDLIDLLLDKTQDAGALGYDVKYGYGILDPTRLLRWNDSSYSDLGIIAAYLDLDSLQRDHPRVDIRIQNLGNTPIYGIQVICCVNGHPQTFTLGILGVSEAHEFYLYPHRHELERDEGLELAVFVSSNGNDYQTNNNQWKGTLTLGSAK